MKQGSEPGTRGKIKVEEEGRKKFKKIKKRLGGKKRNTTFAIPK
jgi:hypothetical protein